MAANYVEEGEVIEVIVAAAITPGTPLLIGTKLGIALGKGAIGDKVRFALEGVWKLTKANGSGLGQLQGTASYWDNTAKKMTNVATSNTLVATAFEISADNDTIGVYRLIC